MVARRSRTVQGAGKKEAEELGPLLKEMDKRYGVGVVKKGTDIQQPERIPTDVFMLDFCLLGGIPVSRGTMLVGHKHSGKTSLACKLAASAQRVLPEQRVAYVDVEGCIAADSRFLDMDSGQVYTAQEVYDRKLPLRVRSYDQVTKSMCVEPLSAWFDNGVKNVLSVQMASTELRITENHRVWARASMGSPPEWVRADTVEEGWYIASPGVDRSWEWAATGGLSTDAARFIGMMLGDGTFGGSSGSPVFCNVDQDIIEDMRNIVASWGGELNTYSDRHHRIIGQGKASKWAPPRATELLREVGLYGTVGAQKFIPAEVFQSGREAVLHCLAGLYLTDGTVDIGRPSISFSNTSLTLIEQVQEIWRRFGVAGTIHISKMYREHHAQQCRRDYHCTGVRRISWPTGPRRSYPGGRALVKAFTRCLGTAFIGIKYSEYLKRVCSRLTILLLCARITIQSTT